MNRVTIMSDAEWLRHENRGGVVMCQRDCIAALGLAGMGQCFLGGDYTRHDCPRYISHEKYEAQHRDQGNIA